MERIYNGSDIILDLSRISKLIDNCSTLNVRLFTTSKNIYAEYSLADVENYRINVTYDYIKDIGRGVVNCLYNVGFSDADYPDGEQNKIGMFTTDFYLASDTIVPEDSDTSILDGVAWGNIVGSVSMQTDLMTLVNGKVGNTTFNEAVVSINAELSAKADSDSVYTKTESDERYITEHQDISGLVTDTEFSQYQQQVSTELGSKANASDLAALSDRVDNLPIEDDLEAVERKIDNHIADSTVHVTNTDKARWNAKQEAGDYATNARVDSVQNSVSGLSQTLGTDYYSKGQTDNTFLKKSDAANTYQPIGVYTTKNYVDNNFMRKTEPVVINQTETTVEIQPNVLNVWGTVATLTITLAEADPTKYNEYMIQFESGATPTTLTLPSSVQWLTDAAIEANTTYQISIVNNLGILEGWED